jgi:hypothetical protein
MEIEFGARMEAMSENGNWVENRELLSVSCNVISELNQQRSLIDNTHQKLF